ncbi:alpha/beta hydrolase family protein [Paenibacillus mucilaginosus]|uniref:Platelet-activating factor acetylhydrolase plasma/intracellular isoform II n=1 Tax=Paenibacillus mucilaginosus (strain KNP414) TaxID=1036673 RepID=F8F6J1_PAEMK|nr:dienelactone hydrolase family protein [Paenibacillus mucilaginosus]AEI42945.1 Platelet-activating factor acetylhydrolase plasma/intracellular isoform II [Paenibacillus mucilaginosus KNP414]MCG7216059.1 dienelactone hydrolase family protein [Paenibacillus mucilaginosus]
MRLLEILLIGACLTMLLQLGRKPATNRLAGMLTGTAGIALLAFHLAVEGYRWQMLVVYITALICAVLLLLRPAHEVKPTPLRKAWRYGVTITAGLLVAASSALAAFLPVFDLPKPNGPYKVGTRTLHLTDASREEPLTTDPKDRRELMVQLWYPASNPPTGNRDKLFPEEDGAFEAYKQAFAKELNIPGFALDYWRYIRGNAYENAALLPSGKPYPLLLIGHGMGTGRILHSAQAENLASNGYIVAVIDHTYSTVATIFPNGKVTGFETDVSSEDLEAIGREVGGIWNQDAAFLIRHLEKVNAGESGSEFSGKIDMNNIGIVGHSFGGAAAFELAVTDPRIKAGINMDGTLYPVSKNANLTKPFLFIESEETIESKRKHLHEDIIQYEESLIKTTLQHNGSRIYMEGTAHYNFTDFQLFSDLLQVMGLTGEINGRRGEFIVNQYVLDFFNKQLKGTGGELIQGPNPRFPEVKFNTELL